MMRKISSILLVVGWFMIAYGILFWGQTESKWFLLVVAPLSTSLFLQTIERRLKR